MKPTKNRVYCNDCSKPKILFASERKANNFIRFNSAEIALESGYSPVRSYYCSCCGGWHVTSRISLEQQKHRLRSVPDSYLTDVQANAHKRSRVSKERKDRFAALNEHLEAINSQIQILEICKQHNYLRVSRSVLNLSFSNLACVRMMTGRSQKVSSAEMILNKLRQELEILSTLQAVA